MTLSSTKRQLQLSTVRIYQTRHYAGDVPDQNGQTLTRSSDRRDIVDLCTGHADKLSQNYSSDMADSIPLNHLSNKLITM